MVEQFDRFAYLEKLEKDTDVIVLHSLFSKEQTALCEPTKDVRGKYYGLRENPNEDEKKKGGTFLDRKDNLVLRHGTEFNLKDERDRAYWNMVKYSPLVAFTPEEGQYNRPARFVIYIEGNIAKDKVSKKILRNEAENLIIKDTIENLKNRLKVLGINMDNDGDNTVRNVLLEMADLNPEKIINLYDASIGVHMLVFEAIDNNIIFKNKDDFYQVANTLMGTSVDDVVAFLNRTNNEELLRYVKEAIHGDGSNEKPVIKMKTEELVKYLIDNTVVEGDDEPLDYSGLSRGDLQKQVTKLRKERKNK